MLVTRLYSLLRGSIIRQTLKGAEYGGHSASGA
jgi:hypothetical protein